MRLSLDVRYLTRGFWKRGLKKISWTILRCSGHLQDHFCLFSKVFVKPHIGKIILFIYFALLSNKVLPILPGFLISWVFIDTISCLKYKLYYCNWKQRIFYELWSARCSASIVELCLPTKKGGFLKKNYKFYKHIYENIIIIDPIT